MKKGKKLVEIPNGPENKPRNNGENTEFLQKATNQGPRDIQHKPVVADAPEVPFSSAISGTPVGSSLRN